MRQSVTGAKSSALKLQNLSAILLNLLHNSGVSRVQLAQSIGVSTATITNLVGELVAMGLVVEEGTVKTDEPHIGRPQRALRLVPESRFAIGIHIDVGNVHIILSDLQARPIRSHTLQHSLRKPWKAVLSEITQITNHLIGQTGVNRTDIVGIGVAASGLVDTCSGVNVIASNLDWHNVPIGDYLAERLELPVIVDNNVRAMALGESLFGSAQDVHALAFIYARIGVGAGLVVGGQLYRGAAAGAGEIGHTTIVPYGGDTCHCGNTGCLETLISEPVIARLAQELAQQHPDGILAQHLQSNNGTILDRIFNAVQMGDDLARAMLEERARYMGIALANLVNIFNPELIILGGIFHKNESILLPVIEFTFKQRSFANLGQQVRIQTTEFGDDVGMIGAAALALDGFFYRPQNRLSNGELPVYAR